VTCLDLCTSYLGGLYTKHDSGQLVTKFKEIQAKLERM